MASSTIKRVAASVDNAATAQARVAWAASMASAHGAQLIGLAAAQPYIPVYSPFGTELLSVQPEVIEAANKQVAALLKDAAGVFEAGARGTDSVWKESGRLMAPDHLCREARGYDVLVMGRTGARDSADNYLGAPVAEVVLTLGRPVVVVPPEAGIFSAARVAIAWKDRREARRALADALPFLNETSEVFVCAIGEEKDLAAQAQGVADYLKAHGHAAKTIVESAGKRPDSAALLEIASRVNATLLVAGAYGQSRFKEWVFGGVTRDLLDHAPVPCLLSH